VTDPAPELPQDDGVADDEAAAAAFGPSGSERSQARERALTLLYEAEAKGQPVAVIVAALPLEPLPFTTELTDGVEANRTEIDGLLERFSTGWSIERMPVIDRAILRIGTFELAHRPDVPTAVVLSEAVGLAGRFSTDDSGRFVNGLLARIAREVRPEGAGS
jgi:N utilization substance protein B